ncbi:MAG TPA: efflux RND transporter periplasmic adaptor subunit [Candidatus Binatia bacterium]|nr:efflux RND transporter periplasmic adaptor subunit [Candidatus Binatia bacterium]
MNTPPPGSQPGSSTGELRAPPGDHLAGDRLRPPYRPSGRRRALWFLVVLVICGLLLGGFWGFEQFKQKMIGQYFASMTPPPTAVETYKAATEAMPRYFESIGTVVAVHQVTVSPQVEGRISALKFESGDTVKQGAVLVQLDDSTERADLASFQAQMRLAQANLARARQLASKQFGSRQDVDVQQSELDQANAGIAKTLAQIDYKLIRAPFDGVLGIRQVNLGQYLAAGAAIVTLTDLDHLYVDFTLPEQDRSQLSVGQAIEIRADAFPQRVFQASIQSMDPQVDPNMRAVKVRAALANPDHALQPGMYGKVRVVLPPEPNVVTIPEPAIDYTVYGESVYLVKEAKEKDKDGKPQYTAEQTFVTSGAHNNGKVGIVKGIQAGDVVVVGGQLKLHNGAPVSVSQDHSLESPTTMPVE